MTDTYFDLFLGYSLVWLVLFLLLLRLTFFQKKLGDKISVLEKTPGRVLESDHKA